MAKEEKMKNSTPKLRFKEFTDEWQEKKLGDIAKFYSGGTPTSTSAELYSGDIPFIKSGEIDSEFTAQKISDEALRTSSAKMVSKGDILYALYGATSGQVAIAKIGGAINQAVLCIQPKADRYFIYQWLLNQKDKILSAYLQGGQGNLSADIVKKLHINFPEIQEQEKIARFLTAVDEKINKLEEKKKGFEKYKKGVMQVIFSQKIRFKKSDGSDYPDWEEKKLGEIVFVTLPPMKLQSKEFNRNGKYPIIDQSQDFIAGYTDNRFHLVPEGEYIIFGDHTECIKYVDFEFAQGADGIKILQVIDDEIVPKYLYFAFLSSYKSEGSYKRHWSATKENKILLPPKEEQDKIAEFLTLLDNKVELINKELEKAKLFKKSLLQQMFV